LAPLLGGVIAAVVFKALKGSAEDTTKTKAAGA